MRNRAPFIWTAEQDIRHDVIIAGLMGARPRDDGLNRFFLMRRTFSVQTPRGGNLHITCDGRYRLFVNGHELGRGPARCTPTFQRYDTYDLDGVLREGENVLAVVVHTYGVDTSWYEMCRELWGEAFGDGGLWLVADIDTADGVNTVASDTDWQIIRSDAWLQDVPTANHGLGFVEALDARALPENWNGHGFDDSHWPHAIEQVTGGGGPDGFFGGITFRPFPILVASELPALTGDFTSPTALLWQRHAQPTPELPFFEQPYQETLGAPTAFPLDALMADGDVLVFTSGDQSVTFLFDMGAIVTGHPTISMDAKGGEIIDIAVAEGIPGEWAPGFDRTTARITPAPVLGADVHLSRYTARAGLQTFERFDWQAVRYLQVTVRNAPSGLSLSRLGVQTRNYPVDQTGRFSSNDPVLDQLWRTGAYTLHQCMHDGWEDCPGREQRQWSGDATVQNLVGHTAFGPDVSPLNVEYLRKTAESQRADGLTQMFAPGNHGHTRLLIPDWTLQWILNAADHYLWSGDLTTICEIWPAIVKALAWFRRARGDGALVADMPHWHFMDWAALGRSGYATALNAQLAGALDAASGLGEAVGDAQTAEGLRRDAGELRHALESHWDEARGVYVDMRDPQTGALQPRVSQHSNAAMILWGAAPQERYARIISYIMDEERGRFTAAPPIKNEGEAVNEATDVVVTNTFYSHYLYEALNKAGRTDLVLKHARKRYGPMLAAGATTLWESFEPTASLCHGFSASPTYQLSTAVLGVRPLSPGANSIIFKPNLADLSHASGVMPFVSGVAEVELSGGQEGFTASLQAPETVDVHVRAHHGFRISDQNKGLDGAGRQWVRFRVTAS